MGGERRRGRSETALEAQLRDHRDVPAAQRAVLRQMAHAVDIAEALADPDQMSESGRVYLDALAAAGLTATVAKPVDAFDDLVARLATPSAGHTPND